MQLNDFQKSKVCFHLGYNAGAQVPAGDRSRLEEAMALVPDSYFYDQLVYQIRRCEVSSILVVFSGVRFFQVDHFRLLAKQLAVLPSLCSMIEHPLPLE